MEKVELRMNEVNKYTMIKKTVASNGNRNYFSGIDKISKQKAIAIYLVSITDTNSIHFCEILERIHSIKISTNTF